MQTVDASLKVVLIKLTRSYPATAESSPEFAAELYDATRRWWKIAASRTTPGPGAPDSVFAVYRGVVKAAYTIESWTRSPDGSRFGFEGKIDTALHDQYCGADVSHYFPRGAANPIRFVNCSAVASVSATPDELEASVWPTEAARAASIAALASKLNEEPLARIMLGGRELFHSNILGWFAEHFYKQASDVFDGLYDDAMGSEPVQGYVRLVRRERRNLDLTIWWDDHRRPLVVENKVFSLPDPGQLDKYSRAILGDDELDEPRQVLLSLQDPQWDEDTFDTAGRVRGGGPWRRVSYGVLGERILTALRNEPATYEVDIMRHYGEMVCTLQQLADAVVVRSYSEPVLLKDSLPHGAVDNRLLSSLSKLRARSLAQVVQADMDRANFRCTVESGFSNGTPVVSMLRAESVDGNKVRLGWQLQGREFRLCAVLPDLKGKSPEKRASRVAWGVANADYFEFRSIDKILHSETLREYPETSKSMGGFNRFDPDFIYRSKKLSVLTVGQLLKASSELAVKAVSRSAASEDALYLERKTDNPEMLNSQTVSSDSKRVITVRFAVDPSVAVESLHGLLIVGGVLHAMEQVVRPEHGPVDAMKSVYNRAGRFEVLRTDSYAEMTVVLDDRQDNGVDAAMAHRTVKLVQRLLRFPPAERAEEFQLTVNNVDPGAFDRYGSMRSISTTVEQLNGVRIFDSLPGFEYGLPTAFDRVIPRPIRLLADLDESVWNHLGSLVQRCAEHTGSFGRWTESTQDSSGTFIVGYSTMGPLLEEAFHFVYENNFVLQEFDWMNWEEGHLLLAKSRGFLHVPADVVLGLITLIARTDRFSEGSFLSAFDDGTMPALLRSVLRFRPKLRS